MQVSLSQTRLKAGLTREQIFTCQKKYIIAELSQVQQSTMGKKIWLSIHPRNFGSDKNHPSI